ncbi:MAG TPA: VOC family protein [Solirubrobacteraceae bacterium]|nr:VOC family protein [Solirubrobacteraceae bacterium]
MFKVSVAQLWVHDQDEALDFYTQKLGMEVRVDVTLAGWATSAGSPSGPSASPRFRSCSCPSPVRR